MNPKTDDPKGMSALSNRYQMGLNIKSFKHYIQSARTGTVTYFDYGIQGNLETYGTETPPLIPFQDTNNPVALLYSSQDYSSDQVDAEWYAEQIENELVFYQFYDFSHIAFIIGFDTLQYLDDLLEIYEAITLQ